MRTLFLTLPLLMPLALLAQTPPPQAPSDASAAPAASPASLYYSFEKVMTPPGVDPQVGALTVLPDQRVAVAFHHGEVGIYTPSTKSWQIFAEGLHEPLGMLSESDGSLLVMQRAELTRLKDLNQDGVADLYETAWSGFGLTGNYHEFAFGPVAGPNGTLFVGLNLASNGDTIFKEIRGPWNPVGMPREEFYSVSGWNTAKDKAGRMYSRVPWRGWIMEIDPKTGSAKPYASGFRSPDGLGFTPSGELLVSDNQGDWRGSSELHVVAKGGFYGHPAGLIWRSKWDGRDPLQIPTEKLEAMRTPAAVWFPHNLYANSPTQPVTIPKTPAWGAFGGQTLIGEMNSPRLLRLLLEKVDGMWQGACVNLGEFTELKLGLHRLAFRGDDLWVGRTHLSWAGSEGLAILSPKGKLPFDPLDIHVTPTGFTLSFTEPLAEDAAQPARWPVERYTYAYHAVYGSPQLEKSSLFPKKVVISKDRRSAELAFENLTPNFVYDFNLAQLESSSGLKPLNQRLAYTLRKVPKTSASKK
jgi:glucose/arabinose dehydrogenase